MTAGTAFTAALVALMCIASYGAGTQVERNKGLKAQLALVEQAEANVRAAREEEQQKAKLAEGIAYAASQREAATSARAAAADRAVGSLRDEIARLNAVPAPSDPAAAAAAGEARLARELLGSCADRYRAVAASADELRDQVMGLQEFAHQVCKVGN